MNTVAFLVNTNVDVSSFTTVFMSRAVSSTSLLRKRASILSLRHVSNLHAGEVRQAIQVPDNQGAQRVV